MIRRDVDEKSMTKSAEKETSINIGENRIQTHTLLF
jgi:hypothetical protein